MGASALARLLVGPLVVSCVGTAPALADDADLPIVVNDAVTPWPGEWLDVNVLANDSDPVHRRPDRHPAGHGQ